MKTYRILNCTFTIPDVTEIAIIKMSTDKNQMGEWYSMQWVKNINDEEMNIFLGFDKNFAQGVYEEILDELYQDKIRKINPPSDAFTTHGGWERELLKNG